MWQQIRQILEMIRFSHSVFALPFALLAAVLAWTAPVPAGMSLDFHWWQLLGLLVCIVGARSAAMAFNRIADVELDRRNPRTQMRHLPTQAISMRSAVVFTLASGLIFIAGTALFLPNALPLILSLPILIFLLAYSYMKRVTWLVHFWLGAALALAPIAAWIAIRGEVVLADPMDLVPVSILGLAVLFWVAGFDIIYACQDFQFDRSHGVHSVPATFGIRRGLQIAAGCHMAMMVLLITLPLWAAHWGPPLSLGFLYWLAVLGIGSLLVHEHRLVRPDDLSRTQVAFFNVNAIISVGLFVAGSIDVLWL
jgi:4-hydroxybenzoate polyprenyltransferase